MSNTPPTLRTSLPLKRLLDRELFLALEYEEKSQGPGTINRYLVNYRKISNQILETIDAHLATKDQDHE